MNSGLPPLRALRAFEAVVRCGSITAAAADLGVTHGAVSKQVAQLEDWFGRRLFRRMATGVRPTPETRAFAEQVGEAFHRMRRASEALANVQCDDRELLVLAPATFAMQWLVPRLSGFGNPQSDAPIRVQTSQTTDDWEAFTFDVAIRRGFAPARGYRTVPFLRESLTLLAPPAMERDLKASGPGGLAGLTLLSADTRPHELERWLEAAGLVPTGRIVLAGSGPLLLLVGCQLLDAGAEVAAVLETTESADYLDAAPALPRALAGWRDLARGVAMKRRLRRAGVE